MVQMTYDVKYIYIEKNNTCDMPQPGPPLPDPPLPGPLPHPHPPLPPLLPLLPLPTILLSDIFASLPFLLGLGCVCLASTGVWAGVSVSVFEGSGFRLGKTSGWDKVPQR